MNQTAPRLIVYGTDEIPLTAETVRLVGGKAMGLHEMRRLGMAVPPWATLTTELFRQACFSRDRLQEPLRDPGEEPGERSAALQQAINSMELDAPLRGRMEDAWLRISNGGRLAVAVRSSAIDEDSEGLSFAGQMESVLNVVSREEYFRALRRCWASLFCERAVFYRQSHGLDAWSGAIAVIIQEMVEPEVSGVIFTANPITGNRNEMLINSVWGLGEGLVSGRMEADTFLIEMEGGRVDAQTVRKERALRMRPEGGTKTVPVPEEKCCQASLSNRELGLLAAMGQKIRVSTGLPMDIEFALSAKRIYLLQARPITALPDYRPKPERQRFVWDNSNIVESYEGITLPLTFSFIRRAYRTVYWQFCEVLGVSPGTMEKNRRTFENMLGLIQGRVYYNLLNWYKIIGFLPGFRYNKGFFEEMIGLRGRKNGAEGQERASGPGKWTGLADLLKISFRALLAHLTLQRRVRLFHEGFEVVRRRSAALDYSGMLPEGILSLYADLEREVLSDWKAPVINDFEAMIFYGYLKRLTGKWGLDEDGSLPNDLLCGEGGIGSAGIFTELLRVARTVAADEGLKKLFLGQEPETVLRTMKEDPRFRDALKAFENYLDVYGVRGAGEMKLESIPMKENPGFAVAMVRNYLCTLEDYDMEHADGELAKRLRAQLRVREKLQRAYPVSWPVRLCFYRWVLRNCRRAIRNRENQRFARAEGYDLLRRMLRAVGEYWAERGVLVE